MSTMIEQFIKRTKEMEKKVEDIPPKKMPTYEELAERVEKLEEDLRDRKRKESEEYRKTLDCDGGVWGHLRD